MSDKKEACASTQAYFFSKRVQEIVNEGNDFYLAAEKARVEHPECTLAICFTFPDGSAAIFDGSGLLIKK